MSKKGLFFIILFFLGLGLFLGFKNIFFNDLNRGKIFYKYFDFISAKEKFKEVLKKEPGNLEAHLYLALINTKEGDFRSARSHLEFIRNHTPRLNLSSDMYKDVGLAFYLNNDYKTASRYFQKAITKNKRDYESLFYMGLCKALLDDIDSAISFYKEALKVNPRHMFSLWNLAVLLEKEGFYQEAIKYWQRYLEVVPVIFRRIEIERRIEELEEFIKEGGGLRVEELPLKEGKM